MITSPMHNAKWYCYRDVDANGKYHGFNRIEVWWDVGDMKMRINFIVRNEEPDFWGTLEKIAHELGREGLWREDETAKRMREYAWWKRNSSMFA